MRITSIWASVVDGVPTLDASLGKLREAERQAVLRYLRSGTMFLRAPGLIEDWLDPSRPIVVPNAFRTDGSWIWAEELLYYVEHHDVSPEQSFLDHIQSMGPTAEAVPVEALREAEALLLA
jgi:hypothetical protein